MSANESTEAVLSEIFEYRKSFDIYRDKVCHALKVKGDIDFLIEALENDHIRELYNKKWYPECLYLLAMVDYLSNEYDFPLCSDYDDLRDAQLCEVVYPSTIIALTAVTGTNEWKERSRAESIPEFIRHNIVESDIRNVV